MRNRKNRFVFVLYRTLLSEELRFRAAYLSFFSIISTVPFLTLVVGALSYFSILEPALQSFKVFAYRFFKPIVGNDVVPYVEQFLENARDIGFFSFAFTLFLSFVLIHTIHKTLNHIFRVSAKRSNTFVFFAYWLILIFGPIIYGFGAALVQLFASTYCPQEISSSVFCYISPVISSITFNFLTFFLMYAFVPNRKVVYKFAANGAIFASMSIEVLFFGFEWYLDSISVYSFIYGHLSALPIMSIWIFSIWIIIIAGAEVTVGLMLSNKDHKNK